MINAIRFYYGYPFREEINDDIHERAVMDCETFNRAMIKFFSKLIDYSQVFHEDNTCYFYSLLCEKLRPEICLPKIISGSYTKKNVKLPCFTFCTDYLQHTVSNVPIFIDDELANHIGKRFEKSYGFEFIKYKRVKLNG